MATRRIRLARARKAAGYTQEGLARAMNIETSTVARWEAGSSEPLPYKRPKLGRLLHLGRAELEALLREGQTTSRELVAQQPGSAVVPRSAGLNAAAGELAATSARCGLVYAASYRLP